MTSRDRDFGSSENRADSPIAIVELADYQGISETIRGFQRVESAIAGTPGIKVVSPVILQQDAYDEFEKDPSSERLRAVALEIWGRLDGDHNTLIARRLFPNSAGERQSGPRSPNISHAEDLIREIKNLYEYYDATHKDKEVLPEIMVHRVVDAGNPPQQEEPFLPYPGGDVIPLGDDKFQVQATFGADESVQNFPTDKWTVEFSPNGSLKVGVTRENKDRSKIPGFPDYLVIDIPAEFRDRPPLDLSRVVALAELCQRMSQMYGSHRLEFDGTRFALEEPLVIIEAAPFKVVPIPREILAAFEGGKIKPMHVFPSDNLDFVRGDEPVVVFISNGNSGRGEEIQSALRTLAGVANYREVKLLALVATNISTQHVVRNLTDLGHGVKFVDKKEEFGDGDEILFFIRNNDLSWERKNPVVIEQDSRVRSVASVGGKAIGLEKLVAKGFETSPYFLIETSLYRRLIDELGLWDEIDELDSMGLDNPAEVEERALSIKEKILAYDGDLIKQLSGDLGQGLEGIGGEGFFVRSSATCEDAGDNANAGIFGTVPNIDKKDVPKAILEVFASVFKDVSYIRGTGVKMSDVLMGVVVQRAVDAVKSGTIFTKDRDYDDGNVLVVDVNRGQGSGIVDGTAKVVQALKIDKTTMVRHSSGEEILSADEISKIIRLGLDVERLFAEGSQDIEWAQDEWGKIYILQTRPL